ncbi:unnamed protein product [Rotaria magnacalcarata]|uniref:Uncharacterized protein n=1 Tax=Rotaria magnacalcarata TaxID=392030 RepID=A0A818WGP2_9BILA|nr:unnamed protein product [Rotaria magnacalcarata]CAF1980224.1 unnamed protein product [Rotaria magnacalcarata]CAF2053664.1 unnamed protein product [Rotaria magnacalcarata]CAF3723786.1 unnamed protein product [Rotaria magnacalcarata]CAF3785861.1 unnamed protein product [Rotaria magnacalcarata]
MNDVHQPVISAKMPTIRQRLPFNDVPSVHMIKLKRGLIQRSLLYCFEKGYFSLIRYLLQSDSTDARERDHEGRTGLMYCCFIDSDCWAQSISMTLLEYGAKIEDEDQNGLNALHYAIITQRSILVRRYLAALDFNLSRAVDIYGNTCLHYACSTGNTYIVRSILDAMKRYSVDLSIKNHHELTALDIACQLNHEDCQNLLSNEITLIEHTNKVSAKTHESHTTMKSLLERRSSMPARTNSTASTAHLTESIVSVPIIMSQSKTFPNHMSTTIKCNNKENIVNSIPIFVDPIKSRRMSLRRNETLDLTLANQVKGRVDFATTPLATKNATLSASSSTWRDDFSHMFNQLQTFKTSSYRKTVHAPLSTEIPSNLFESTSEVFGADGSESHHQSQSSIRTNLSQKAIHRRQLSAVSALLVPHKMKK